VVSCLGEAKILPADQVAQEFEQRSWHYQDGLPAERVWAISQTPDGFLWIGTQNGLARFDGDRFVVFDHVNTPALANDDCRSLAVDTEGTLWIATSETLVSMVGNHFTRCGHWPKLAPTQRVPLGDRSGGGVWAGGDAKLLSWRHGKAENLTLDKAVPGANCQLEALVEQHGLLWAGGTAGLLQLDPATQRFAVTELPVEIQGLEVMSLWRSNQDELWALLSERLPSLGGPRPGFRLGCIRDGRWQENAAASAVWFPAEFQSHFLTGDAAGALWLPASINYIHRYVHGQLQRLALRREGANVYLLCTFVDREGNLWLGTEMQGLQRWSSRKIRCYTPQDGLDHANTWTICETRDGSVLVGTDGGVSRLRQGRFTSLLRPDGSAVKEVRSIVEDSDGTIWIGTIRSLERIQNGEVIPAPLPGEWTESKVRALHPACDGGIWVGTVRGLTRIHGTTRTKYTMADGLGSDEVRAILEDRAGTLWVGTLGGGLSHLRGGRFTTWTRADGLCSDNVWALHEGASGTIWIGTETGLCRLGNGRVHSFAETEGLLNLRVNCLQEDNLGRLWIGSDKGICWVDTRELEAVANRQRTKVQAVWYGETDGLLSLETNGQKSNPAVCRTHDGHLWFPTTRGVAVIDPASASLDLIEPRSAIAEVRANAKLVYGDEVPSPRISSRNRPGREINEPIRFPPGEARVLEFRFSGITFDAPEKTRFRYRLIGLDDHWLEAGTRREAYLTDLRPGRYRFELAARSHHGVWQEQPVALAFEILPHFYQAWWFYLAAGSAAMVLVTLMVVWRVREIRRIHQLERSNALNEQRRQIGRDIHDELGASLTHIVRLSADAGRLASQPDRVQQQARRIAELAGEAVDQIGEIVWANNPAYDNLEDLVAYLREYAANFFAETLFQVEFKFPESVPSQPVSGMFRRHLVLVVKEALQNISKHSQATTVRIQLDLRPGWLQLSIDDNGRGLAAENRERSGNGLTNMRLRISELNGTIDIVSAPGRGTALKVGVPILGW